MSHNFKTYVLLITGGIFRIGKMLNLGALVSDRHLDKVNRNQQNISNRQHTKKKELNLSTMSERFPFYYFKLACSDAGQRPALPGKTYFKTLG